MAIKYREAEELRLSTRKNLTATPENWLRFLRTASNTYKYSYQDQLMIAAQFPQATAVAAFDVWSDRFGRKIRAGEKGIGLIDDSGSRPRMKYVFDISQSSIYRDVPQPYIWELTDEIKDDVRLSLAGDLLIPIEQSVSDFCENTVDGLFRDYEYELLSNAGTSDMFSGLDETAISAEFRQAVLESVKYVVLTRCGLDTDTVDKDVFNNLYSFSDVRITDILGTAISNISEQALREIENTVKTIERRNQNERNIEEQDNRRDTSPVERGGYDILSNSERGQADRFDIYSRSRNIHISSEPDSRRRRRRGNSDRDLGRTPPQISEEPQRMAVSGTVRQPQAEGTPVVDREGGGRADGQSDRSDDEGRRSNRAAESDRSNGVGTQSELDTEQSRGDSVQQSDLQVSKKPKQKRQRRTKKKAEEQTVSPVFSSFPVGEQLSMFADESTEQNRINEYVMSRLINNGTGFVDGKFRIADYFSQEHTKDEKAKFLSNEYGWGGSYGSNEEFEARPGKGLMMKHVEKDNPENNITIHLTYPQVVDMIDYLIQNDRFITQKDIEERQQRAIYFLKNYDPNNPLEAPQIEQAKAILDSYNIDYSQLLANQPTVETATPEQVEEMNASIPDDTEIPDINAPSVPIEQEESVYSESAVVAEFRNKTMESFHLIGDRTEFDIELEVEELLRQEMIDNEIAGDIEAVVLYGSRSRGLETSEDTDIDIVVQINNSELKEDALFNLFSDMDIEIDGISVDVNPIRPEETGTMEEYLPKAEAYLEQKQSERIAERYSSFISEADYDIDNRDVLNVNGGSIYTIPIKTDDALLHRLADYGIVPTDEMKQVYLGSDYGTSWNKLIIQDEWGNRFNNIDMSKVLTADELRIAQAVLDKVNDLEHPRTEQTIFSSVGNDEDLEIEAPSAAESIVSNSVSVSIGFSESAVVDEIFEIKSTENKSEPFTFATVNAIFEYLDGKQHLERLVPSIEAGWYKKTDFEIRAVINGEEYNYSGRFDIGDGKGTGGGSLTDHISDFVDYTYSPANPLHLDADELAKHQKVRDVLLPFLREHEQLTPDDERFIEQIKSRYPMRITAERLYSLVGKTIDYNDREYVVDRIDIQNNKAHIRDDNTGWYPLFQDVELSDVVGQNIGLLLNEKEQFFRDCDLPSLLAKSSLAWDEIEDLGRIFFDEDYIDNFSPDEKARYGNGLLSEPQVYELAKQYRNGEEISRELAHGLFKSSRIANLPLSEDGYGYDDVQVDYTRDGYRVQYGMYSREVTFEEMAQAYLQHFKNEYEIIHKAVAEEEKTEIKEEYDFDDNADKFFFRENGVEEIYYNPDSTEGGQFVIGEISFDDILEAEKETAGITDIKQRTEFFFSLLAEKSRQTLIDITSEDFGDYVDYFNRPANLESGSANTMSALIARAKRELRQEQQSKENPIGTYKIYQLKDGEETRYKRFERLANQPEPVSITDYNLVYEGSLSPNDTLDSLYEKFNLSHPEDFTGHSLSVSDVIVIEQDGQQQAYFVDRFGFQSVPDFFRERTAKQEQSSGNKIEETKKNLESQAPKAEAENYKITDPALGQRPVAEKFKDNLAAIRTLKQLEAEDRDATPEEQEILSKYTGWGGMSKVFEPTNKHYPEVRELLTDDEFAAARKSTMTAFYTSPVVIKEMYAKLADMGMNGGSLLEPSCGIGNFIGMIPGSNTRVTGIELDSLTGRIAQKLYPQAQIQVCGFENSKLKENSFDVAVGNVPFGDIRVFDKQYNQNNLLIHDYFFSKSLDMVKPGGVVAFITSKGTLDKLDPTARRLLAEKSEFLGAVRLPNNAFKANAGTEVTSDIIFLQKRTEPLEITLENEPLWIQTSIDSNGIEMNAYFAHHPEQICGTMEMVSGQYGMESTCQPNREIKLSEQIRVAMANIQGRIETITTTQNAEMGLQVPNIPSAPESLRNSSYFFSDGKPYFLESGESRPVSFPKSREKKSLEILLGMVAIRDTVRQLLEIQLDENVTNEAIKAVQSTLSQLYDDFVKKHGRVKNNADIFKNDSSFPLLKSLERYNENGEYIGKADIFTKRTIKAEHTVTEVATSVDALTVSLSSEKTKGTIDLDYMSQLTGFDKDKIIADLQGVIFKLPNTDMYVPADEYLSGNILQKLEKAQAAFNAGDTSLAGNITALKKAMPERLTATDIDIRLGATWIKSEYIRDFVYQLLGTPSWHQNPYSKDQFIDVQYSDITGKWFITNKGTDKHNVQGRTTYGTADKTAYELIEDALNLKATTVKVKQLVDGKEKYVVDSTKTAQARAKQDLILQKFKEWIFSDKTRRDDLVETYNRQFNSTRPREYDGSHLNFVGMNPEITLRSHQLNAVARCLYGGNTLLAHEVGAGKTFEMIAAAMEGKRLGLHTKSLVCVPNHLTEQIGADFLKLYPNANILVATKKDFEKENRKALMAKIATGNYDAIIIGHSQLEKIPLSQERQQQFIEYQIEETMRNLEELKAMNGERYQIKQAEKTKANLEAKLKKLLNSPKDDTVTFEELGIDKLFLDEAHLFKNLFLSTKMQNVSGISTSSDVQKTADLFMKTQYLDEITGGKGLVFATGTPVSNTMCEIYNMMRYLQMDLLREKHLEHFDSWASTFGENVTQMELTPEGNSYRAKTRFSKFYNLPELMAMFKECADIQTADTLSLPGIPECEIHNVAVEPSEVQKELVEALSKRAEAIHNRQVDPSVDNMLKITTDGRKIGLDQRLINPDLPDEPNSKVNTCIENVFDIWGKTADTRGTQLIFCDFSTPKNDGSFNVYDDIKAKLIDKGIPENQIAFIHDATNETKREELFAKVRSGEVRVIIGSTSKMGAGTNVQNRLVASHDLDAPYRPADMEQRRGRMVRQGNQNSKVHLYRYCTKDTFDAYLFQMLERKQSFISQVMTSNFPQRRCDDMDEATLSYAEVKALCVGDPRIREKMELDNEVGKLRLERNSHQQEQYRLEDIAEDIKKKISILETNIPKNQNDFLYVQKHPTRLDQDGKKIFEGIILHGKTYTDKKEAAEAFKNAYMTAIRQGGGHRDYVPVGEYRGFKVAVLFDSFSQTYKASLSREGTYFLDLGTDNFLRMDNVLDKLESVCSQRVDKLNDHKKSLAEVTEQIGKPFPKEAEFKAKTDRLAVLNAELDTDGRKNEQGGIIQDDTPPTQSIASKR